MIITEIPRDWGLYGNGNGNIMVSEFVLGAQIKCGKENELSNEDMKYKGFTIFAISNSDG